MATISEANALIKWFDERRGKTLKLNNQGIDVVIKALSTYCKIPKIIEELREEVYRIDDSATLSSRDVLNEEDVFEKLELLISN